MTLFEDSLDRSVATKIASVAMSNEFLSRNISTILPNYDLSCQSAKANGTVVEAAVSLMSDQENDDLAKWLVMNAVNEIIREAK